MLLMPDLDAIPMRFKAPENPGIYYIPGDTEESIENLVDNLNKFGLADYEIDLVIDRCIDNMTFGEIAEKHHYTSKGMAHRHFKIVMQKLRDGGFKIRE